MNTSLRVVAIEQKYFQCTAFNYIILSRKVQSLITGGTTNFNAQSTDWPTCVSSNVENIAKPDVTGPMFDQAANHITSLINSHKWRHIPPSFTFLGSLYWDQNSSRVGRTNSELPVLHGGSSNHWKLIPRKPWWALQSAMTDHRILYLP